MARSARRRRPEARQNAGFRVFLCALAVFTLLGLTRVSLSARIAQAAIDADKLMSSIDAERLVSDELEIDRGVLSRPERLATIASASMCMAEPAELGYLDIEGSAPVDCDIPAAESAAGSQDEGSTLKDIVAAVMDMAAGEAEVLLVGDVGLASSR